MRPYNRSAGSEYESASGSDSIFEGKNTKEIGRGAMSVQAFVLDAHRVGSDAKLSPTAEFANAEREAQTGGGARGSEAQVLDFTCFTSAKKYKY